MAALGAGRRGAAMTARLAIGAPGTPVAAMTAALDAHLARARNGAVP